MGFEFSHANVHFRADCWAAGTASGGCGHLEKALRECMDAPVRLPITVLLNAPEPLYSFSD